MAGLILSKGPAAEVLPAPLQPNLVPSPIFSGRDSDQTNEHSAQGVSVGEFALGGDLFGNGFAGFQQTAGGGHTRFFHPGCRCNPNLLAEHASQMTRTEAGSPRQIRNAEILGNPALRFLATLHGQTSKEPKQLHQDKRMKTLVLIAVFAASATSARSGDLGQWAPGHWSIDGDQERRSQMEAKRAAFT